MAEMHASHRPFGVLVKTFPKLSETFILEELLGLERLGERFHVFAMQAPSDAIAHQAVAQVRAPVSYLPGLRPGNLVALLGAQLRLLLSQPARYLSSLRLALSRRGGLRDLLSAGWLRCELERLGIGHLHTHFISRPADIAELVARLGVPFSISAHAKDIYLSRPEDLRRKLAAARFTVTCTDYNRQVLCDIAPGARVSRMYHGVDLECFSAAGHCVAESPPRILAVGRLREKKGFDTLIEACRQLHLRGIALHCVIVGYGDEREALARQIEQHGLERLITLAGKLPREAVIEHYARATVFVQPSRIGQDGDRDGIPNVLLEAMSMQRAVISTRVSGIPELISHEHNGLLVDPDQPTQLADALLRLFRDAELRARLGAAARATVHAHFDNDRNLRLLATLLETSHERTRRAPAANASGHATGVR